MSLRQSWRIRPYPWSYSEWLNIPHIKCGKRGHIWDEKLQTLNFERNLFTDSWTINWNVRKCVKLQIFSFTIAILEIIRHLKTIRAKVDKRSCLIITIEVYTVLKNRLIVLNKSFERQNEDRIKLTMSMILGKEPLSNVDTKYTLDGEC